MNAQFHTLKRETFLSGMQDNSIAIFFSGRAPRKSADSFYPFDVDKNFYYLTGIDREDLVLLLMKIRGRNSEILYFPPSKELVKKWNGILICEEDAMTISGISDIHDRRDFKSELLILLSNVMGRPQAVYLFFNIAQADEQLSLEQRIAQEIQAHFPHMTIMNSFDRMEELRSIKTEEEVEEIRRAIAITEAGFQNLLTKLRPGMKEHEAAACFLEIANQNGVELSFEIISASGKNAVTLHHPKSHGLDSSRRMQSGELLLFDAGVKVNHYCADLTRTYPVDGKYSPRQKEIYQIVLACQKFACEIMRPGESMIFVNEKVIDFYYHALKSIGLIEKKEDVQEFFYHGIGHPLGLDVHDLRSRDLILKPGMVYTVEPGLYIAKENLGIRIEDDVLITSAGAEILSTQVSREAADIESVTRQFA